MSTQLLAPNDQMMQWITTKWITKPIYVISELGISDLMCDGPKSVEALAEKTNTHAPTLYRILRALSSVGVFVETEDRVFGLTPLAQCLFSNALRPIARMFLSEWHDKAWNGLSHTVRTGKPGFDYTFGKPSFEWFEENPEERSILDQAQGSKVVGFANSVIDTYDFLKEAPPACDAYFLVNVLHDWDDEICIRILKNITKAMNNDTRLWIIEYIIEPGPGFSVAKLLDLEVLVMGGGRERSVDEYETLVGAAGLVVSKIFPMKSGPVMMECSVGRFY